MTLLTTSVPRIYLVMRARCDTKEQDHKATCDNMMARWGQSDLKKKKRDK